MFLKNRRESNPELLEFVRTLPCIACGKTPVDAHHVSTRGSGGGDIATNLMPLDRRHHSEWHQDPGKFIRKYPSVRFWLEEADRWDVLKRYGLLKE